MKIKKIIFLDTETTGIDFEKDELVQISAILVDYYTQEVLESIDLKIESTKDVDPRVTNINGYYKGKWTEEEHYPIDAKVAADILFKFFEAHRHDSAIFCHNSSFDRAFCSIFMTRHGILPERQPKYWFDSASIAALFVMRGEWDMVSLDAIKGKLKVEHIRKRYHDSLDDCYLLMKVFFEMTGRITVIKRIED